MLFSADKIARATDVYGAVSGCSPGQMEGRSAIGTGRCGWQKQRRKTSTSRQPGPEPYSLAVGSRLGPTRRSSALDSHNLHSPGFESRSSLSQTSLKSVPSLAQASPKPRSPFPMHSHPLSQSHTPRRSSRLDRTTAPCRVRP
jgi:hypothetical protein